MKKFTLTKHDAEKMIERLRQLKDPSASVVKFIEAYDLHPNVILQSTIIERRGGGWEDTNGTDS